MIDVGIICERLFVEAATVVGRYTDDFYAGEPAMTRQSVGSGEALYVAAVPSVAGWRDILGAAFARHDIGSPLAEGAAPPAGVEVTRRIGPGGSVVFLVNHDRASAAEVTLAHPGRDVLTSTAVEGVVGLEPLGVRIVLEA